MKLKLLISALISTIFIASPAFAGTVITSPIDSRPISTDYLGNLAALGGDEYIPLDKSTLDFFSVYDSLNHFGDSNATRSQLLDLVSQHNSEDTTVIINTSSYITGGLVGSRCGINYLEYTQAMNDLHTLITSNPNPKYYINLSMPRSLPETRFNQVWRNEDTIKGLAYYYIQRNPNCADRYTLNKTYARVTPVQFLMEYGYVQNKYTELGREALTPWESDFLDNFNHRYLTKEPYKSYLYRYKLPYFATSNIFRQLMHWQEEGLIDEIIISNDDLQLPNSITYFYNQGADWVNTQDGTPVKYSFARSYMSVAPNSIYSQLKAKHGEEEQNKALQGKHNSINYVFGTDEIPQLIYARDLSKRKGITTDFNSYISTHNKEVGTYDVIPVSDLVSADINFVTAGNTQRTDTEFDLYLYDYKETYDKKASDFISQMDASYNKGNSVGLIEIFSADTLNTGANNVFKTLLNNGVNNNSLSITQLASYSAWNTNANAIGLGVAHSQVYGIASQLTDNPELFLTNQVKMLSQHIFEDGIFTIQVKRTLGNEGFKPTEDDIIKSPKLYSLLQVDDITKAFLNTTYDYDNSTYSIDKFELAEYNFPWCRNFECYIDVDTQISRND